jgi:hypothetical protein
MPISVRQQARVVGMSDGQLLPTVVAINVIRKEMLLGLAIAWDVQLGHAEGPFESTGRVLDD